MTTPSVTGNCQPHLHSINSKSNLILFLGGKYFNDREIKKFLINCFAINKQLPKETTLITSLLLRFNPVARYIITIINKQCIGIIKHSNQFC